MPTLTKPKINIRIPAVFPRPNTKVALLQFLPLERLSLRAPLALTIEYTPKITIVSNSDLELFGYGDTESEAILDFARSLEEFYASLKRNRKKLSRYLKLKFDFLNSIVSEK